MHRQRNSRGVFARTPRTLVAAALGAALVTFGLVSPGVAQAASTSPASRHISPAAAKIAADVKADKDRATLKTRNVTPLCAQARAGQARCFSLKRTDIASHLGLQPAVTPNGYGPGDLQDAYNLPPNGGAGATVAIVDAFDNPNAEADLAVYRSQYGLPPCTTDNGCFRKVDQRGGTDYPAPDSGWAGEIALDVDMVSAAAPAAHILLVEADSNYNDDLGAAVDEAVALGAKYVSNSYGSGYSSTPGSGEDPTEVTVYDPYYNHPGVAVVASSGDSDYGVSYPAASQYVTAVGGTSLVADSSTRGWSESVWHNSYGGPGSGCSLYEAKPAWQTDAGCAMRSVADVSAVADPMTGVAVYNTYGDGGWVVYGGTSASSPLIAGVYADAGTPVAGTVPASYPYAASGGLNDVTAGNNGSCSPSYYCTAGPGYDGPTGLGTPNGVSAFTTGPHGHVTGTVTDSATGDPISGATVAVGDASGSTDADGHYDLSAPVGTYDVTASAYAHESKTVTGVSVTDGGTVTEDFALDPVASVTVSGVVSDGSGHGWPLYATVSVDGMPGGPVFTDPFTGHYSVTLPADATYQVHVTSNYPGYQSVDQAVTVGSDDTVANVSVPVEPQACAAAGYAVHVDGTSESFDSTSTPAGWTLVDNTGKGDWRFDDPRGRGNLTGGAGGFAIMDSDYYGLGNTEDASLVSPITDLSTSTSPDLGFDTDYRDLGSTADVDLSIDGGATWTTVWEKSDVSYRGPAHVDVPLPQAAGQSAVQVRFHYTGTWAWWWELDNVFIGTRTCDPVTGGLVAGIVTDANTSDGVVGATVTSKTKPDESTSTVATPDDPNLGDGFYHMFSSVTGSHKFTAAKKHYQSKTKTVDVAASFTTRADFKLKAGHVTVTPTSVDKTVGWGKSATQTLTVKNTGGAPATVDIGETPGGSTLLGMPGAQVHRVSGTYSPLSLHGKDGKVTKATGLAPKDANPADAPWASITNYPVPVQDNGVAVVDGKVYSAYGYNGSADMSSLYVYDPDSGGWTQLSSAADTRERPAFAAINGLIYATGGWGASGDPDGNTEIYDPSSDSWSTGPVNPNPFSGSGVAVLDGKLYIVGGCTASACGVTDVMVFDPAAGTWTQVADYPVAVSWESCGAIGGQLVCAGGTNDSTTLASTYVYNPGDDSWSQSTDMPVDLWGSGYIVSGGQLLVSGGVTAGSTVVTNQGYAFDPATSTWATLPNSNNSLYRGGSACGFYKIGGNPGGAFVPPVANSEVLPGFIDCASLSDVSWLSATPTTLTLAAGASATVAVTVDASVADITQPGVYTAKLSIGTDTPYAGTSIPVSMTVKPPKSWGKIAGTVTGPDGPIAGATVQIDSWATSYTLKTDKNGQYALWLDKRNNPLTVICAKDGYQPQVATVKIKKGQTVTVNFSLKKA